MPQLHQGDILLDRALLVAWPMPSDDGDKFDRGTVLVVAGSAETPGAALLAGSAALRMGGGRLQVATAAETATAVAVAMPEAKVTSIDESEDGPLAELLAAADAVVIGPGLGDLDQARRVPTMALECARDDTVIAVDAIGLAALPTSLTPSARPHRLVITPNRDELRSLTDEQGDTRQLARAVAQRFGLTVVSFGHVASPDGRSWVDTGTVTGLGTSGAGDVLAGAVGGVGGALSRRATSRLLGDAVPPPGRYPPVRSVRTDRLSRPTARRRAAARTGRTLRAPRRSHGWHTMNEGAEWTVHLDVREDAPSMFVPAELLPDAAVGDVVTITSSLPATVRRGRIVERIDDQERGRFSPCRSTPTMGDLVVEAARNNAEWCDIVCRAHGLSPRFDAAGWTSEQLDSRRLPRRRHADCRCGCPALVGPHRRWFAEYERAWCERQLAVLRSGVWQARLAG